MANEKRLIDANALTDVIEHTDWYHISVSGKLADGANPEHNIPLFKADDIYEALENAPTVDAVEVVRCKDCKQYEYIAYDYGRCRKTMLLIKNDDFCSRGERREGE